MTDGSTMQSHYILYLKLDMEVNLKLDMEVNLKLDMEVMQGHTILVNMLLQELYKI